MNHEQRTFVDIYTHNSLVRRCMTRGIEAEDEIEAERERERVPTARSSLLPSLEFQSVWIRFSRFNMEMGEELSHSVSQSTRQHHNQRFRRAFALRSCDLAESRACCCRQSSVLIGGEHDARGHVAALRHAASPPATFMPLLQCWTVSKTVLKESTVCARCRKSQNMHSLEWTRRLVVTMCTD